jgi:hypothetical protein
MRGPLAVVPLLVLPVLVVGWGVGLLLVDGPRDPRVHFLSVLAAAGGLATLLGQFHNFLSLRQPYPPLVIAGGSACVLLGGYCLWREPSLGLGLRLSVPLFLTGLTGFYCFYFSMFRGRHRISRLQVGDRFPDFVLPNTEKERESLASILTRGPVLMLFYKGDW